MIFDWLRQRAGSLGIRDLQERRQAKTSPLQTDSRAKACHIIEKQRMIRRVFPSTITLRDQ